MVVRLVALLALACAAAAQERAWWVVLPREDGNGGVLLRADGKASIRDPGAVDFRRRLSPDGRWLVWEDPTLDRMRTTELFLSGRHGGHTKQLTRGGQISGAPSWLHDSKRIAFLSNQPKGGRRQVFIVDVHGGAATRITDEEAGVVAVRASPRTNQLAYVIPLPHRGKGWIGNVIIHDLGSGRRTLVAKSVKIPSLAWSPDGKRLAVSGIGSIRIYEGTKVVTNVDLPKADQRLYAHIAGSLVWRPDGKELACSVTFAGGRAAVAHDDATGNKTADFDRIYGDRELFFLTLDGKLRAIEVPRGVSVKPHHWAR